MKRGDHDTINSLQSFSGLFPAAFLCVCLLSFTACGRRGDPMPLSPFEREPVAIEVMDKENVIPEVTPDKVQETEEPEKEKARPEAPSSLRGVYMQAGILLTWDEIIGQDVTLYRVYRLEGEVYTLIGEPVTPVFTDRDIENNRIYRYRVTAVNAMESPRSEEITLSTETK